MKELSKYLYKRFPFKKELCFLIKRFYTPGKKVYRKLYFEGEFTVKVDADKSFKIKNYDYLYIEKCLFWKGIYGEWEKHSLKLWSQLCEDSMYIFDIGANTGVYSLLAKTVNPDAKVFAFEPVERIYQKLNHNIRINKFDIQSSDKAVSNRNGESVFYDQQTDHSLTASLARAESGENNSKIIETKIMLTTLDAFIEQHAIPRVDLLKIDVETFETEVLEGFRENLHKFKPSILIEILNERVAAGVSNLIAGIGYDFYNVSETAGITKVGELHKSDSYNYLLCTPEVSKRLGL